MDRFHAYLHPAVFTASLPVNWMREMWAAEGKNPRTGLPLKPQEKQEIEDNKGSVYQEEGEEEEYDFI